METSFSLARTASFPPSLRYLTEAILRGKMLARVAFLVTSMIGFLIIVENNWLITPESFAWTLRL